MRPPYSSRLHWSAAPNSVSRAIEEKRRLGGRILDLTQSNPTNAGLVYPPVHTFLSDPRALEYHASAAGMLSAREAVSAYYANQVPPDRILLTASTSEAYSYLFKLLCDPGDQVLVPRPSYPLFDMLAQLEGVQLAHYPLRYHDGWFIDVDGLRAMITPRTRAIIWVNPNNPTGSYLKPHEVREIAALCEANGLALISDEVFADYELSDGFEKVRTVVGESECLSFALSGLSKVSGLPQMKLGWIVASGPEHRVALDRLEWIADSYLSVGTPVQLAAGALLDARLTIQAQIRERAKANLDYLRSLSASTAASVLDVEGGWYATLQVPRIRSEEAWTLELLERGVLVQPGFFFDFESEAFLVLSLLTEPAVFQEGVRNILDAC